MLLRPLTIPLQKKAENELNEVPSRVGEYLKRINEWLTEQPHLKVRTDLTKITQKHLITIDGQWLLSFLRGCKFSLQQTKEKLDLFYTTRSFIPEFFTHRDPFLPEIQEFLKRSLCLCLPKPTSPAGPIVVIVRPTSTDPEKISFVTALKASLMIMDILLVENDNFIVAGQHVVCDLQDLPYKYIIQMTPSILKKAALCLQYAYPTRPQGFHFINSPPIFESVYNLLTTFITEEITSRVRFYSKDNIHDMYKTIPLSVLPKEYGGEEESIEILMAKWKLKVESYQNWFLEDAAYYSDESKRPGKPRTAADMFATETASEDLDID